MTIEVQIKGTNQIARFPDGTPPEAIENALRQQNEKNAQAVDPALQQLQDNVQQGSQQLDGIINNIPPEQPEQGFSLPSFGAPLPQADPRAGVAMGSEVANATLGGFGRGLAEVAAGTNKAIIDTVDMISLPGQVNSALELLGSDFRLPTAGQTEFVQNATKGGFVEGKTGEVLRAVGQAIPAAFGAGQVLRTAASALPKTISASTEGFFPAAVKKLAEKTTIGGDVAIGAGAGAGAEAGKGGGILGETAGALAGGITAGGLKAALTKAPSAIKSIFSDAIKTNKTEDDAAAFLAEQMVREGVTASDIEKRLIELGPEALPADAAITFARILRTASNEVPRIEGRASSIFRDRQASQPERLVKAFDEVGGTAGASSDEAIIALNNKFKPEIDRLYQAAREKSVTLGNVSRSILENPGLGKDARNKAEKILQTRRILGDKISNIDIIDATKQQLDDQISVAVRQGERGLVRELVRVKNALVEDADRSIPEYAKARSLFAGKAQLENATETGAQFFKLKPEDIKSITRSMGESEKTMFKLGVKDAIIKKMDDAQTNADLVRRLFGKRGEIKKLKFLFKDKEALKKFSDTLEAESRFIMTRRAAEGNSSTVRQATDSNFFKDSLAKITEATSSPVGFARVLAGISKGLGAKKGSKESIDALTLAGDILLDKGADPKKIAALLKKGNAKFIASLLKNLNKKKPKAQGVAAISFGANEGRK